MIFAQSYKNLSYLQKKKENFFSFIKEKQYLCTLINQNTICHNHYILQLLVGVPQDSLRRSARH